MICPIWVSDIPYLHRKSKPPFRNLGLGAYFFTTKSYTLCLVIGHLIALRFYFTADLRFGIGTAVSLIVRFVIGGFTIGIFIGISRIVDVKYIIDIKIIVAKIRVAAADSYAADMIKGVA